MISTAQISDEQMANTACAICASSCCVESIEREEFPVGEAGKIAVAYVPIVTCTECGFSFSDHRAEPIRHDAACAALGLLNPTEIKEVRALYDLNRTDFATTFKISRASLERWENRKLMISEQSSMYLRALQDPAVGHRLANPEVNIEYATHEAVLQDAGQNVIRVNFRSLSRSTERMSRALRKQQLFALSRVGQ